MKTTELRTQTAPALQEQVRTLRRRLFKLKLSKSNPEFKQSHQITVVRRQIAQTLTVLAEKAG